MERRTAIQLVALALLGGVGVWLWTSRAGRRAAESAGSVAASGAIAVTNVVKPLYDKALGWLYTTESKANLARLWDAITKAADAYGVPPLVLARMAYIESGFRSDVINGITKGTSGEIGITQVIPKYHPGIDLSTPEKQLMGTAATIASYAKQFGSYPAAVAAWNAGPGTVAAALKAGDAWRAKLPAITQNYLTKLDQGIA